MFYKIGVLKISQNSQENTPIDLTYFKSTPDERAFQVLPFSISNFTNAIINAALFSICSGFTNA